MAKDGVRGRGRIPRWRRLLLLATASASAPASAAAALSGASSPPPPPSLPGSSPPPSPPPFPPRRSSSSSSPVFVAPPLSEGLIDDLFVHLSQGDPPYSSFVETGSDSELGDCALATLLVFDPAKEGPLPHCLSSSTAESGSISELDPAKEGSLPRCYIRPPYILGGPSYEATGSMIRKDWLRGMMDKLHSEQIPFLVPYLEKEVLSLRFKFSRHKHCNSFVFPQDWELLGGKQVTGAVRLITPGFCEWDLHIMTTIGWNVAFSDHLWETFVAAHRFKDGDMIFLEKVDSDLFACFAVDNRGTELSYPDAIWSSPKDGFPTNFSSTDAHLYGDSCGFQCGSRFIAGDQSRVHPPVFSPGPLHQSLSAQTPTPSNKTPTSGIPATFSPRRLSSSLGLLGSWINLPALGVNRKKKFKSLRQLLRAWPFDLVIRSELLGSTGNWP